MKPESHTEQYISLSYHLKPRRALRYYFYVEYIKISLGITH